MEPWCSFNLVDPGAARRDYAALLTEWRLCRQAVAHMKLEETYLHPRFGMMSLRWLYLHMIREYAGHCGTPTSFASESRGSRSADLRAADV